MVNLWLLRMETSKRSAFSAFFRIAEPARGSPDRSSFMQIFEVFESALNQTPPVNPTAFSIAAATFSAGNKTNGT
jgi:hypothetical protein